MDQIKIQEYQHVIIINKNIEAKPDLKDHGKCPKKALNY